MPSLGPLVATLKNPINSLIKSPIFDNAIMITSFLTLQPSVVINGMPIYNVDRVEVSSSHDIQKERAIGQIFYAHQRGANLVMTIHGYLWGPLRLFYLTLFELLHYYGKGEATTFAGDKNTETIGGAEAWQAAAESGAPSTKFTRTVNSETQDVTTSIPANAKLDPLTPYFKHKTFTVVTAEGYYTRMFMKTFSYNTDVDKNGISTIEYTLIIERYVKPPKMRLYYEDIANTRQQMVIDQQKQLDGLVNKIYDFKKDGTAILATVEKLIVSISANNLLLKNNGSSATTETGYSVTQQQRAKRGFGSKWVLKQDSRITLDVKTNASNVIKSTGDIKLWSKEVSGTAAIGNSPAFGIVGQKEPITSLDKEDLVKNLVWRCILTAHDALATFTNPSRYRASFNGYEDPLISHMASTGAGLGMGRPQLLYRLFNKVSDKKGEITEYVNEYMLGIMDESLYEDYLPLGTTYTAIITDKPMPNASRSFIKVCCEDGGSKHVLSISATDAFNPRIYMDGIQFKYVVGGRTPQNLAANTNYYDFIEGQKIFLEVGDITTYTVKTPSYSHSPVTSFPASVIIEVMLVK